MRFDKNVIFNRKIENFFLQISTMCYNKFNVQKETHSLFKKGEGI